MEAYYKEDLSDGKAHVEDTNIKGWCQFSRAKQLPSTKGRGSCLRSYQTIFPLLMKTHSLLRNAEPHQWFTRAISDNPSSMAVYLSWHVTYSPYYYNHYLPQVIVTPDCILLPAPVTCREKVVHVGRTSLLSEAVMSCRDGDVERMIYKFAGTTCRVNTETKRPEAIAKGLNIDERDLPKMATLPKLDFGSPPEGIEALTSLITDVRDVDHNDHVSVTAYVTLFNLCLERMLERGRLPGYEGVVMSMLRVRDLKVQFLGQAFLGDKLDCFIWVDTEDQTIINGELRIKQSTVTKFKINSSYKNTYNTHKL